MRERSSDLIHYERLSDTLQLSTSEPLQTSPERGFGSLQSVASSVAFKVGNGVEPDRRSDTLEEGEVAVFSLHEHMSC
jgi:hypothetical protein